MTAAAADTQDIQLGDAGRRTMMQGLGVGIVGVVVSVILYAIFFRAHPERFFRAYLVAFMLAISIPLASLLFIMIFHATRAGWFVCVRRIAEATASNLTWMWVLFLPLLVAMWTSDSTHLYEWNVASAVAADPILQGKAPFLNATFWTIRAAFYFLVWGGLAKFFVSNSVAQDERGDVECTHRMQRMAPVGILLGALTISFAGFDWMMSLEPHWFSTIFGVNFFASATASAFSFIIILTFVLQKFGKLQTQVTEHHYHDLGKLLFAFGVVFWAYISYSQFMLIWYGNLPEETTWYLIRGQGGWWLVSLLLVFGHFVIPFFGLLSRHVKRKKEVLVVGAVWMLVMAAVDFYWVIMPKVPADLLHDTVAAQVHDPAVQASLYTDFINSYQTKEVPADVAAAHGADSLTYAEAYGLHLHLVDLTLILGLLGLLVAGTFRTLSKHSLLARQDPRLPESLAFENI